MAKLEALVCEEYFEAKELNSVNIKYLSCSRIGYLTVTKLDLNHLSLDLSGLTAESLGLVLTNNPNLAHLEDTSFSNWTLDFSRLDAIVRFGKNVIELDIRVDVMQLVGVWTRLCTMSKLRRLVVYTSFSAPEEDVRGQADGLVNVLSSCPKLTQVYLSHHGIQTNLISPEVYLRLRDLVLQKETRRALPVQYYQEFRRNEPELDGSVTYSPLHIVLSIGTGLRKTDFSLSRAYLTVNQGCFVYV
jgi:hypothetical protein